MRRQQPQEKEIQTVVYMAALSSAEHIVQTDLAPRRILSDINLNIGHSQTWGITARTNCETRLLLEIMGNIRPYDGGKCILVERGMMRRKRVIQPHTFYIGNTDILYDNMNVLEYLMFATAKIRKDRLSMQEELFEFLIDIGLGSISLTAIKWLTPEEKAMVILIAAAYSDSILIIFNLPELVLDARLHGAMTKVAGMITQRGKTLVISTNDHELIDSSCSHTAYIADGRILYGGPVHCLRQRYDKVTVIIEDPDIISIKQKLTPILDDCKLVEKEGSLLIKANDSTPNSIYQRILDAGIVPQSMLVNKKTVSNACEEFTQLNDLSEQLF